MSETSLADIELLNAHGPYNHAIWRGEDGRTLTHEEALEGRGEFIAAVLRRVLTSRFAKAEIESLTIADIGCYDGWLLHRISDLPFPRMLGIEPRRKNIDKGKIARKLLGIETRVEFVEGSLDELPAEQFDVVVATGLLHHVESCAQALRKLRRVCRRLLFVETIVLDSKHVTPEMRRAIEPKDVVYFGRDPICGVSGQKLESAFYDGSSTGLQVVSIPTWETLALSCEAAGFSPPVQEVVPEHYRSATWNQRRQCQAAIFTAAPVPAEGNRAATQHGIDYERQLAAAIFPLVDIYPLYEQIVLKRTPVKPMEFTGESLPVYSDPALRELAAAFRHSPEDKIRVEYGKTLLSAGNLAEAEAVFLSVTQRWNADWRSVYRSFHYLRAIARSRSDSVAERRYAALLTTSNAHFPADAWPQEEHTHV